MEKYKVPETFTNYSIPKRLIAQEDLLHFIAFSYHENFQFFIVLNLQHQLPLQQFRSSPTSPLHM